MRKPFIIGIAGGTASGKTTLANRIQELGGASRVSVFSIDWYYIRRDHQPMSVRALANYDHPDALEMDLVVRQLSTLARGEAVDAPCYDFAQHTRSLQTQKVSPSDVLVVEGILALYPTALRDLMQLKVFVETPDEVRFKRRLSRDVAERGRTPDSVREQWQTTVQPMFEQFCSPTKVFADILISGEGAEEVHAQSLLRQAGM